MQRSTCACGRQYCVTKVYNEDVCPACHGRALEKNLGREPHQERARQELLAERAVESHQAA